MDDIKPWLLIAVCESSGEEYDMTGWDDMAAVDHLRKIGLRDGCGPHVLYRQHTIREQVDTTEIDHQLEILYGQRSDS